MTENKFTQQESLFINYAKALGIITVVIGHYGWHPLNIYLPYIYHMPLFFIIGGFIMKPINNKFKWIKNTLNNYILYILVWFIILGLLTYLINRYFNTSIDLNIFSQNKTNILLHTLACNMHNNSIFLVAWFLIAYIFASSFFRIQITFCEQFFNQRTREYIYLIIGIIAGYVAIDYIAPVYKESGGWYYNLLCQFTVGYMYLSIGYFLSRRLSYFSSFNLLAISILLMVTFSGNGTFKTMFISWSDYPTGFLIHLVSSLTGCITILSISYNLSKSLVSKTLSILGEHTKDIMTFHLIIFVMIDIIFCYFGYFKFENIKALDHFSSPSFWAIYICAGLYLPIAIRLILNKIKLRIARLSNNLFIKI